MRKSLLIKCVMATASIAGMPGFAYAACGGAAAPGELQSFNSDPTAWVSQKGKLGNKDAQVKALAAQVKAVAAAAINAKDPNFGKNLGSFLGGTSIDQGTAIGAALGGLSASCKDPNDPTDAADKQYIATNIAPNVVTSTSANTAFGNANGSSQPAATTGGGSSSSGGAGGVASSSATGAPTGGSNTGSGTGGTNQGTQTAGTPTLGGSAGSASAVE